MKKIKVLIIDDSALVRQLLATNLSRVPDIEVVGTASDVYIARDKIVKLNPDVLTLDVEMPKMDGVEFLRKLMPQYPIPTVVVSSLTQRGKQISFEALEAGAIDFVPKPSVNLRQGFAEMMKDLIQKIRIASVSDVSHWKNKKVVYKPQQKTKALEESTDKIIAIGASTGGTEALKAVLTKFPADMPGVVVVQHMPPGFTKMFADTLNNLCKMNVKEGKTGDRIMRGEIIIAPGNFQLQVVRRGGIYEILCLPNDFKHLHCPSIDVMMLSVAKNVGKNAMGAILTGMGKDGSQGLLAMKKAGSFTVAQDEKTSVVYGMPKVAFEVGAVDEVLPLDKIGDRIVSKTRNWTV